MASAVVIRDMLTREPRGSGFVELAEGEDLQLAVRGLNGQALEGCPLTVNEARPKRTGFSGQAVLLEPPAEGDASPINIC